MYSNKHPFILQYLILLIIFSFSQLGFAQDYKTVIPDSLKQYTYKELYSKKNENTDNPFLQDLYSFSYLNKAKKEKDSLRITYGYSQVASYQDDPLNITYLDSIIYITKKKNYDGYRSHGYLWKGFLQLNNGLYDEALKNLILAQNSISKDNKVENLIAIQLHIGILKAIWGDKDEAIIHFNDVIKKFNENNLSQNYNGIKSEAFKYLSYCHILNKQYDSAYFYAKKYKKNEDNTSNNLYYSEIIAEIELHKKNYTKTLQILQHIKKTDSLNSIINHFNFNYLFGSTLNGLNKKKEAFYYFSKADSIYNVTNDLMPETRKVKEFFINYYKKKDSTKKQLLYINQLLTVDSLIYKNTKTLNRIIQKEYDEPQLLAEKEKIIKKLSSKTKKNYWLIVLLSTIGISSCVFFYFYYKKQKSLKVKFETLIKNSKQTELIKKPKKSLNINDISTEVIEQINSKLIQFENENLFTQNNLTLSKLAKQLGTNSNYLSKVVNYSKGKNFSSYITSLRINYCIKKLKEDAVFRKYSIKAIATEIGFNNAESFSKAFFTETKKYPSAVIKELNKQ
ncbi:AraC-type DNA-binding protein [Lutibacter oricola]|uniref:AraC-type DNA-binding protein n=1 Tax=Lutibacter oricola TaxID=762486 RepID=A0A1H3G3U4_9FLAO|nr:helix-turn-helix domain-containing protein [Lutibacter oricola]SDX97049.1 AraC-type DNA-binding protein [Lutibacter oricola]